MDQRETKVTPQTRLLVKCFLARNPLPPLGHGDVCFLTRDPAPGKGSQGNCRTGLLPDPVPQSVLGQGHCCPRAATNTSGFRVNRERAFLFQHRLWPKLIVDILLSQVRESGWFCTATSETTKSPASRRTMSTPQSNQSCPAAPAPQRLWQPQGGLARDAPANHHQALEQEGQGG